MKFRLWKNQNGKWVFFSEIFESSNEKSLGYQRAARLIFKGWIPYLNLPSIKGVAEVLIAPLTQDPIPLENLGELNFDELENLLLKDESKKAGQYLAEFIQKTKKETERVFELSEEEKIKLSDSVIQYWMPAFKRNEFVPAYVRIKIVKLIYQNS